MTSFVDKIRFGFTKSYWVANTLELFERFAFYGSKAILTYYLAIKVGLGEVTAGTLAGLFSGLLYSLPIVAGVFVDRYGFRKTLIICFSFFTIGYFLIGFAGLNFSHDIISVIGKTPYMVAVLVLTAIGGSLIKPCIVGTVAKTTNEETKSLGYSIYYTIVNIGGAIGPILALQVRENLGIEFVLIMSSVTSLLLIFGAYFFFDEPVQLNQNQNASLKKVFSDMLMVFKNFKFMLFLVIFSGFWIMFWQIFYSFPFYITQVLKFERFELLETIDAWTIIIVTVPITGLVKKYFSPIVAMSIGFFIASASWLLLVINPTITMAIVAMALFAIGEATQAPRFYEYVSSLAPKEQVGTYMGFAFLPVAIGSFVAGPLAGFLVKNYLKDTLQPEIIWYVLSGIGFTSAILMLIYNSLKEKL